MAAIPWDTAFAVFLGTLPLLGAVVWNLMEVKGIRQELVEIRRELVEIRKDLAKLGERVATLEERDRWTHPISRP